VLDDFESSYDGLIGSIVQILENMLLAPCDFGKEQSESEVSNGCNDCFMFILLKNLKDLKSVTICPEHFLVLESSSHFTVFLTALSAAKINTLVFEGVRKGYYPGLFDHKLPKHSNDFWIKEFTTRRNMITKPELCSSCMSASFAKSPYSKVFHGSRL